MKKEARTLCNAGGTIDAPDGTAAHSPGSTRTPGTDSPPYPGESLASSRVAHKGHLLDWADDREITAWLDIAALPLRYRRAFAADCQKRTIGAVHDAAAQPRPTDFAQQWIARTVRSMAGTLAVSAGAAHPALPRDAMSRVARLKNWLRAPGRHLLTLLDDAYPSRLRHLEDPPPLLYVLGDIDWLHQPMIAIVGSRRASAQGNESAAFLAAALGARGWSIVSGLAEGIDAAAHRAVLPGSTYLATYRRDMPESVPISTIAVIGTGIDQAYPACHRSLSESIGQHGAVLSEWPLGTPPKAAHFPQRNRLIAALAHGVVVVEAALRSGSLITARLANELGRDVFALPGSIFSPQARGCHALIKDGATLVECVEDIIDTLPPIAEAFSSGTLPRPTSTPAASPAHTPNGSPVQMHCRSIPPARADQTVSVVGIDANNDHVAVRAHHRASTVLAARTIDAWPSDEPVLAALGHDAVTLDMLCLRTGLPAAAVAATLASYEIDGIVVHSGGRFTRLHAPGRCKVQRNVLKSTSSPKHARETSVGAIQAATGNVVESAADSAPRQTEADERAI
ncbi:DNA processing protein [Robbsia andropogonis]|uniref:DNA-processing protein DprA n=1 Tax=Robbsia andropogonis TaxID=28092 RepID=UPI003D1BD723